MDQDQKYIDWINQNVKDGGYGHCKELSEQMQKAFPELKLVRGHYYCLVWGERGHWWLVSPDGVIVDPTAGQFPTKGRGKYVEWIEGTKEPTGKCPNCGGYCYDDKYLCCERCEKEYIAYCNNPELL